MATVFDAAKYILQVSGSITAMKLQKLCYYSQAWSLVWDEAPLFNEEIQAWANGPVCAALYSLHKGSYSVNDIGTGDANALTPGQKETVNRVIEFYSKFDSQQLSDLTHSEAPWREARRGIPDGVRSERVISLASMAEYYSSLN